MSNYTAPIYVGVIIHPCPNLNVALANLSSELQLEQLEHLRPEISPQRPMITHTRDSHQIPSQN